MITISGSNSYCPNPNPNPVPNVTVNLTGDATASTLTDGSGNYTFSSLPSGGTYTVTLTKTALTPGSSGIDTVDAIAGQRHFLGVGTPLSGCRLAAADVNGDATVNTADIVAIQRFVLGATSGTANVGKYKFIPASRTYPGVVSDQTGQNYDTMVLGDVISTFADRSEGPSQGAAGDGSSVGDVLSKVATVALPNVVVDTSMTNFNAGVKASTIDGQDKLIGFQGDVTFDSTVITFESGPVQKAGLTSGNWNVTGNVLDGPGPIRTLRVSAFSNDFEPLSGSGTLFELRMIRVGKAAQVTQLFWAAPPDHFYFIDADLNRHKPGYTAPGSVTPSWVHEEGQQRLDASDGLISSDGNAPSDQEGEIVPDEDPVDEGP